MVVNTKDIFCNMSLYVGMWLTILWKLDTLLICKYFMDWTTYCTLKPHGCPVINVDG